MADISQNSKRIVRNTAFLFFRMVVMVLIGLFTSRVVLKALGVDDFGIYNAVAGVTAMFTFLSNSIGGAISRYITVELGRGGALLKKIFGTSTAILGILAILFIILTETLGIWFLNEKMSIPAGREGAAMFVLQCCAGIFLFTLMAVPYNALIIAHEKMNVFAYISIVEAVLKLTVAVLLSCTSVDKLELYALLMLCISITVRLSYSIYCKRHFPESRLSAESKPEKKMFKEIFGFAGWTFFGSSAYVVNTQGLNLMFNVFFGVGVNAARGIAVQVEGIVKQFVINVLTAINPQIIKSLSSGNKDYCFELATKASRYSALIFITFLIPFLAEADYLLTIWLGTAPEGSATFVKLIILCTALDLSFNPLVTIIQANGRIRNFYLVTGCISYLCLPVSWILFKQGYDAYVAFLVLAGINVVVDACRLGFLKIELDFPVRTYLKESVLKILTVALIAAVATACTEYLACGLQPAIRMLLSVFASTVGVIAASWFIVMTEGEKTYVKEKLCARRK